ncbi:MAG: hypothetical protein JWM10_2487 [Myxococcaceae bacterium]|nr:hypothetical protein [Myxococcaceae bacterium]
MPRGLVLPGRDGLPPGIGRCVEATPPALDAASAFVWQDLLRLRVVGSDTTRDATRAEVELLDADGARVGLATVYVGHEEGDRFIGRGVTSLDVRGRAAEVRGLRVTLVDGQGLRSATLAVPVSSPVIAGPGQPCDTDGVDNVCALHYRCGTAEWGGPGCVAEP